MARPLGYAMPSPAIYQASPAFPLGPGSACRPACLPLAEPAHITLSKLPQARKAMADLWPGHRLLYSSVAVWGLPMFVLPVPLAELLPFLYPVPLYFLRSRSVGTQPVPRFVLWSKPAWLGGCLLPRWCQHSHTTP